MLIKFKDDICNELCLKFWFESDWHFCNITESRWFLKSTVQKQSLKQSLPKVSLKKVTVPKSIAELWTLISNQLIKDCVRYIFASLLSKSKGEHLWNEQKCLLFHFERSFRSWDNRSLTFQIFKCLDVIKCPSMKHETHFTEQLGKWTHSSNEMWPVGVILQKYKKIIWKMWPENWLQVLFNF